MAPKVGLGKLAIREDGGGRGFFRSFNFFPDRVKTGVVSDENVLVDTVVVQELGVEGLDC
jgi:hypothetical protein